MTREERLEELLSEGLDLCARARQMDAMDRRQATLAASSSPEEWQESGLFDKYVSMHNELNPNQPIATKSLTVRVWMEDQYQNDLADWERRARDLLIPPGSLGLQRTP